MLSPLSQRFIDPGFCMGPRMRRCRRDFYHTTRLHGSIHWQACGHRSQEGGAHSCGERFESRDTGDACRVSKVERPIASRGADSAWGRLAYLSTLPKYLQSWRQIWTSPEAHAHWRRSSEWIWAWQQRRRQTPKLSSLANHEVMACATVPTCSAFRAPRHECL